AMQVTRRDSRSCTLPLSAKWRGSSTNAPFTTPGPLPRSHGSSDAFLGPRFCFHNASPLASNRSAGLPSSSILRYSAIASALDFCAGAGVAASTPRPAASIHNGFTMSPVRLLGFGVLCSSHRRLVGACVALGIHPGHGDLVAGLRALDRELQERVLRHRAPPLGAEHGLAVVCGGDFLDEPRRNGLAGAVFALASLHFVAHQHTH